MVGKKFISRVMEEFLGEYILNISEENLKLGIVRGKLKLDNVQLDGDLIGSHILGAVGLSGFGILSCTARRLRATIPWGKLEKEPTRFELSGLNIICVPLVPSNADQMFGAGTDNDPKCRLKTRAKRSVLARFERNFFSWRIPGEGPPRPIHHDRGNRYDDTNKSWDNESHSHKYDFSGNNTEDNCDDLEQDGNESVSSDDQFEEKDSCHESNNGVRQNTWIRKFVFRMFRNIEVKICDIHLRCEVSEGSLNLEPTRTTRKCESNLKYFDNTNIPADQRSFAFGFAIDSIVYKSANSKWQTGNIDWNADNKCSPKRGKNSVDSNVESDEKRYKVLLAKEVAMYWDDNPPVLISECYILNSDHKLSSSKFLTRIRLALETMAIYQDPGEEVLNMLECRDNKKPSENLSSPCKRHDYCLAPSSIELRITFSNIDGAGPTECFAELLPCYFDIKLRPYQLHQYKTLRNTMIAQQRIDTMLHQRPHNTPSEDPRAWWRYIISCVMTRPNVRPWRDVLQITSKRSQYIKLVMKKIINAQKGGGFHGGLKDQESLELIKLEDFLPIEALLSFHLIALRNVVGLRKPMNKTKTPKRRRSRKKSNEILMKSKNTSRQSLLGCQRISLKHRKYEDDNYVSTMSTSNFIISTSSFDSDSCTPERKVRSAKITKSPSRHSRPRSPHLSPVVHTADIEDKGMFKKNMIAPVSIFRAESHTHDIDEKSILSPLKLNIASNKCGFLSLKSKHGDSNIVDCLSERSFNEESRKLDRVLDKQKGATYKDNNIEYEGDTKENITHRTFLIEMLSLTVVLLDKSGKCPIIQANIQASGCAQNLGNGTTLLCDLKNIEVKDCMHNMTKLLAFHDVDVSLGSSFKKFREDDREERYSSLSLEKLKEAQSKAFSEYLLLQTNTDVPLPPCGVACRLLASASNSGLSLTISGCAATFIWNTTCLRALVDSFFPGRSSGMGVLHRQLRNAATPLAHKAQLALTSPNSLSLKINIDAPKFWFPISSKISDGALFVDAGRLKMSVSKPEQNTTVHWIADLTKIQVNFVRGLSRLFPRDNIKTPSSNMREDIPVIFPFDIHLTFDKIGEGPKMKATEDVNTSNRSEIIENMPSELNIGFSKVSFNLVDVEILAKAIGNWYATQLLSVKRRMINPKPTIHQFNNHKASLSILISIKKIEMMLEGQEVSISSNNSARTRSQSGKIIPKRAYKVQIIGIFISRDVNNSIRNSNLEVKDIRIIQLGRKIEGKSKRNASSYDYTHHQILGFECMDQQEKHTLPRNKIFLNHFISLKDKQSPSLHSHALDSDNYKGAFTATLLQDEGKHINDIDIDLNYFCIHITPTSLHDFSQALSRILELVEIMTREMERRVHETRRNARTIQYQKSSNKMKDYDTSLCREMSCEKDSTDSSLLVKVNLKDASLLATWPIVTVGLSSASCSKQKEENIEHVVIQIFSSVLVMFQSIENTDASGTKTIHVSIDKFSSSISESLNSLPRSELPPIIGPIAAEFRQVSSTVNSGIVVSQDQSIDCEKIKASVTPRDLRILIYVSRNIVAKLKPIVTRNPSENNKKKWTSSLFHYKKKGTAVAASVRFEVQSLSIVLLHSLKKRGNRNPIFDVKGKIRCNLQGCASAMAGDIRCDMAIDFFNKSISDWESVFETFAVMIDVEEQPNEVMFNVSTSQSLSLNLTSSLLATLSEMNFDIFDKVHYLQGVEEQLNYSPIPKLRPIEMHNDSKDSMPLLVNESGLDIRICSMNEIHNSEQGIPDFNHEESLSFMLENDGVVPLSGLFRKGEISQTNSSTFMVAIAIATTSEQLIGKRDTIFHLPINFDGDVNIFMRRLECSEKTSSFERKHRNYLEPVVEWCMQNQRLKSSYLDTSIRKEGLDLLSSTIWSPGDLGETEQHWVKPFLDGDPPEWTDMTCLHPSSRERAKLPNRNWVWANEWTIDLNGTYGETIDADGWEYAENFESFGRTRRFYKVNDACRRRKWTRTRLVIPPKPYDPISPLMLVYKCSTDINGNQLVNIRSKLTIRNLTASNLSFFVSSVSWKDEQFVGTTVPGGLCVVPVQFSFATYLRLGKIKDTHESADKPVLHDCFCSRKNTILTSHASCSMLRTSINITKNKRSEKELNQSLHFLLHIKSTNGTTEILVEPILKILNLLPCQLQYRLHQKVGASEDDITRHQVVDGMKMVEESSIGVGQEKPSLAVNPRLKPCISFRVPGYKWSTSQLIVNRKMSATTWTASEKQKDIQYIDTNEDKDCVHGYKTLIQFENISDNGDPLTIILLVEPGHCPNLKIYAQYWVKDKSGFGLKLSDGFSDFIGTTLFSKSNRHSYLPQKVAMSSEMKREMQIVGHQWPIGMNGMSLYFSRKEKLAILVEMVNDGETKSRKKKIHSNWSSLLDVSNVLPKTVFSVDEKDGPRRFELCFNVTIAPSIFSRTKIITIVPRYQVVNLTNVSLNIAQTGCLSNRIYVPCESTTHFHLYDGTLPAQIRLSTNCRGVYMNCNWTVGSIYLDKVGITSIRLPGNAQNPTIVQAEVRLATKAQDSAVVILLWNSNDQTSPLYLLKNLSSFKILCNQPLCDDANFNITTLEDIFTLHNRCAPNYVDKNANTSKSNKNNTHNPCRNNVSDFVSGGLECGLVESVPHETLSNFVWSLSVGDVTCFGFDDPDKHHILEWTCQGATNCIARADIDAIGSSSVLILPSGQKVGCHVRAENSSKVIEFVDLRSVDQDNIQTLDRIKNKFFHFDIAASNEVNQVPNTETLLDEIECVVLKVCFDIPSVSLSVIDNIGREIFHLHGERLMVQLSQNREGYHELELRVMSCQVDNFVQNAIHPILVFCPEVKDNEPFLHLSAVRRLQQDSSTFVFRYLAIRMLEVEIALDRRTAEALLKYTEPLRKDRQMKLEDARSWITSLTSEMIYASKFHLEKNPVSTKIDSGRVYFEQLHLHPLRISLTFTQGWYSTDSTIEMTLGYISSVPSLVNAPLTFTSFVVSHAFEAPDNLLRIIGMHYFSQLTTHFFSIIGSLAIFNGPADFLANIGTGVRDFFYEPINGLVHGPAQFIEGLETGSLSLVRGVFVGVVKGAASVTLTVNSNLINLTDEGFIEERNAHQRALTDALSHGAQRTIADSVSLAGASIVRGVRSGAIGMIEKPLQSFAKHGPIGFVQGMGEALIGAIVKPVVGVGDGAALVMNHLSEATSDQSALPRMPKRLRRALPRKIQHKPHSVCLIPYNESAAKAQKIVTVNETTNDVYLGHVYIQDHLMIASEQSLCVIKSGSQDPWRIQWEVISHFGIDEGNSMRIMIFTQKGLISHSFEVHSTANFTAFYDLISMRAVNASSESTIALNDFNLYTDPGNIIHEFKIPGLSSQQEKHIFGSINKKQTSISNNSSEEIQIIEQCYDRVKNMGSESPSFFSSLDEEAWTLVDSWGRLFSTLNSRRCVVAGLINASGADLQIKSTTLIEGGSPLFHIPSREYDESQAVLHPGAAMIFFAWGVAPSLHNLGGIFIKIETNAFACNLLDRSQSTSLVSVPGYEVGFLEKSYDKLGWWAKFWLLVTKHDFNR